ncbi:MAG: hypothetical protein NVS9B15_16120 [Acidobacteriaceae bacterium]
MKSFGRLSGSLLWRSIDVVHPRQTRFLLKYPASPPFDGSPTTIGMRTATYSLAIALSLASMTLSLQLGGRANGLSETVFYYQLL